MNLTTKNPQTFDMGLMVMVASGTSTPEEICDAYSLTQAQLDTLMKNPVFRQQVEGVKADLLKNGSMISIRAGYVIAEVAIPTMQEILQSFDADPDQKVKAALALVKMQETGQATGAAKNRHEGEAKAGVSIIINTNPVPVGRMKAEPAIEVTATEITIGTD